MQTSVRRWQQVELVEATGCNLPADVAHRPAPETDTAARLQRLEQLRAAGTITDAEYQQKRRAILDAI